MEKKDALLLLISWGLITVVATNTFKQEQGPEPQGPELDASHTQPVVQEPIVSSSIEEKVTPKIKLTDKEFDCLARNVFYEAGVEDELGKIAVAQVTYNRYKSGRWGDNICSVVHARKQFSWTLLSHKINEKPKGPLWEASLVATYKFLNGETVKKLDKSMFYHSDFIKKPRWGHSMKEVMKIGHHIFYEH